MYKQLIFIALTVFSGIFFSCKKDEKPKTNTEILTGQNWKLVAATVDPAIPIVGTDYYKNYLSDCQKDDFITFYSDNNSVRNEGSAKCNSSDPQTVAGSWNWLAGETQLNYAEGSTSVLYSVVGIADTALVLENSMGFLGTTYTITSTWKKH